MDRNREQFKYVVQCRKSLSARRAWIEIGWGFMLESNAPVALRKESVDRNPENPMIRIDKICRSPQGERG